jgi:hypothetical protein
MMGFLGTLTSIPSTQWLSHLGSFTLAANDSACQPFRSASFFLLPLNSGSVFRPWLASEEFVMEAGFL